MKKLILFLTIAVFPAMVLAQTSGKLAGSVTSADGEALGGANVQVIGSSLGGATDENGRYYILDVPVGTHSVQASYIGYKTLNIDNVRVNPDLTTVLDFALEVAAVEGEEVTVTAERPLINKTATNTTQVMDSETIEALPLRSVSSMVDLTTGVVDGHFRGGRSEDNSYYIDGVLVKNRWSGGNLTSSLSQSSMEQLSVQAGGFSAEYGNANGGVVNVTTKSGKDRISGGVEMVQDLGDANAGTEKDKLYSYGTNILNFDVGGPLAGNIRWYLNVEQSSADDYTPSSVPEVWADVDEYTQAQWASMGYDTLTWDDASSFPVSDVVYHEEFIRDNQTNVDSLIAGVADYDTTHILASNYRRLFGPKKNVSNSTTRVTGNLSFDMNPLRLKVGGGYYTYEENSFSHSYHVLNSDNNTLYNSNHMWAYLNGRFSLSPKSYVSVVASMSKYGQESGNRHHKDNIEAYGERSKSIGSPNYYYRADGRNPLSIPELVYVSGFGTQVGSWTDRDQITNGLRADFVNQTGSHEVKAGVEYYSTEIRQWQVSQAKEIYENISKLDADYDGSVSLSEAGDYNGDGEITQADWDDWRFSVYRNAYTRNIGYNIFGKETDSYNEGDHSMEPAKPVEMRLYLQDKIELKDVVVSLGVEYNRFDPQAFAPDSDSDGYGDDGGFDNIHLTNGRIDRSGAQSGSYKWELVKPHTYVHPRIGLAFPVTDQTVFHANYGTYSSNPPLSIVYLSDSHLDANLTQGNMTVSPNPAIAPQKTTSYEVGFDQQVGQSAAVHITGYYKEVKDYVLMKNRGLPYSDTQSFLDGSEFSWAQYQNGDYGITTGFSANLTLRRTKGFMADLNYTYMNARGTGSYGSNNFMIAWTGETYPTAVNRLEYDQTHTASVMLDYRNSRFDYGVNSVITYGSGQAYTPSTIQSEVFGRGWNSPTASVNSGTRPATSRIDLRVDKGLNLAGVRLNAYVLVLNALNADNIESVYPGSGQPGEDAWLNTPEGRTWQASQGKNYPNSDPANMYKDRITYPGNWGIPRIVRFGLQVNI